MDAVWYNMFLIHIEAAMKIKTELDFFVVNHQYTKAYERALPYVPQISNVEYKKKKKKFTAQIHGTEMYTTVLQFSEENGMEAECSCPVHSPVCKHMIALSLYLQKNIAKIEPHKPKVFKEMKSLSRSQLLAILKTVVKENNHLEEEVSLMVAEKIKRNAEKAANTQLCPV